MQPQYAEAYGQLEAWHWWFRGREQILAYVLRRELAPLRAPSILSVGCGPAEGLRWLRVFAGEFGSVVGLDSEIVHSRNLGPGFHFVVGSLEDAPLRSSSFDVVLVLDVLEHLHDDISGLQQAARLLKSGGLLIVTVPAMPSLWGGQDVVSHHKRRYTKKSFLRLFHTLKVLPVRVTYFNTFLLPPIAAIRWARALAGLRNRARTDFKDNRQGLVNRILTRIFAAERYIVGRVPLPLGVSLLAIANGPGLAGQKNKQADLHAMEA